MSDLLNKDAILNARDVKGEEVEVPEWNGTVFIRVMDGSCRDHFEQTCQERYSETGEKKYDGMKALLLVLTLSDRNGVMLFDEADIDALNAKSGAVIDRLFQKALQVNGIGKKAMEEIAGN